MTDEGKEQFIKRVRTDAKNTYNMAKTLYDEELLKGADKKSNGMKFLLLKSRFYAGIYNYKEEMTTDALRDITFFLTSIKHIAREDKNYIDLDMNKIITKDLDSMYAMYYPLENTDYWKK